MEAQATKVLGDYLRDVLRMNEAERNFRVFGPDETASNRLGSVFEATDRVWMAQTLESDDHLSPDERVMEVLSEPLPGLARRLSAHRPARLLLLLRSLHPHHGFHVQPACEMAEDLAGARMAPADFLAHICSPPMSGGRTITAFPIRPPALSTSSLTRAPTSSASTCPPDANTLLWVGDPCLKTWDRVNVIVAGKQPAPQWLTTAQAEKHCETGFGIWDWAGSEDGLEPDIVMACAGDVPTLKTLAAVDLLRQALPHLRIRVVNVVDLMALQSPQHPPHGLSDEAFNEIFTRDGPVIFAYHGYPYLIHRLAYKRANHPNFHVRGFIEEGTTTTPFDMAVLNELDRFHLAIEVVERLPVLKEKGPEIVAALRERLVLHQAHVREHGEDMPEIRNWTRPYSKPSSWPRGRNGCSTIG